MGRVQAGDRGRHGRHLASEPRAERPVVGLDFDLPELVSL